MVTWDSDAFSSDDDDDSDDHKTTKKKVLASIAINEKPSLFESCDDESDEEHVDNNEHENENDSDSDSDNDEPTKDELFDMLEDAREHFDIKRRECKSLHKELKALKQVFDELRHHMRG